MDSEEKWWEPSDTELEDMIEDRLEDGPLDGVEEAPETTIDSGGEKNRARILGISTGVLSVGFLSPWYWGGSGFQALRWSFQDVLWILTDGLSLYSEWEMTPLDYIQWLMGPLLPLVFVTTFVLTWYTFQFSNHSQQEHEEFSRKASTFHLSFFGVWYLLSIITAFINWGYFDIWYPTAYDIGLWIAAASGIGLHPTAFGLAEKLPISLRTT
jgi:hypothetical protein